MWGKCSEKLQYGVQKYVNFGAKVSSKLKYLKQDHITTILQDLKWINSNGILRLNDESFMYKNLYISADSSVKINFDLRNKLSETRNGSDVHVDFRRTALGQKVVSVSGAKLWNLITMYISNSNTIVTFKSHLYQHLLEHQ